MKNPKVLAIDTSCDETSVAITDGLSVLSNILPSQMEFHKKYGGVVPSLAKLAHEERIDNVVQEALKKSGLSMKDIDAIAVTIGPGLAIALEVGIRKAKALAYEFNKPLIAINHMEGHLLSSFAEPKAKSRKSPELVKETSRILPSLGFLVSGGHTEIILVEAFGKYKKIGETLDDSCGEAYDKCGRMLGFGYPAGPVISEFAKRHRKNMKAKVVKESKSMVVQAENISSGAIYHLPVAMAYSGDLNFSYSGLKTAFRQLIEKMIGHKLSQTEIVDGDKDLTKEQIMDLCVLFEAAAIEQLKVKLRKALSPQFSAVSVKEVWLGGGVVASARLRSELRKVCREFNVEIKYPYSKKLTSDNAAMIAIAAYFKILQSGLTHNPTAGIYTRNFDIIDRDPSLSL